MLKRLSVLWACLLCVTVLSAQKVDKAVTRSIEKFFTEYTSENIRLKKELQNINNTNAQLQLAAERMVNLSEIEAYAKNELGLQKPQNYQIEYINIDKEDLINNNVTINEGSWISNMFSKIIEFFY